MAFWSGLGKRISRWRTKCPSWTKKSLSITRARFLCALGVPADDVVVDNGCVHRADTSLTFALYRMHPVQPCRWRQVGSNITHRHVGKKGQILGMASGDPSIFSPASKILFQDHVISEFSHGETRHWEIASGPNQGGAGLVCSPLEGLHVVIRSHLDLLKSFLAGRVLCFRLWQGRLGF